MEKNTLNTITTLSVDIKRKKRFFLWYDNSSNPPFIIKSRQMKNNKNYIKKESEKKTGHIEKQSPIVWRYQKNLEQQMTIAIAYQPTHSPHIIELDDIQFQLNSIQKRICFAQCDRRSQFIRLLLLFVSNQFFPYALFTECQHKMTNNALFFSVHDRKSVVWPHKVCFFFAIPIQIYLFILF